VGMRRPNILFFFPDQHRHDWVGLPGGVPIRTPNLARLGREGVRFVRAVTPSPLCAPARACLALGREYERCGVPDNSVDLPLDAVTFYRRLRDAGYHVMGCGKFDLAKALLDWGGDGKRRLDQWGFSDGIDSEGKWDAVHSGRERPRGPYMAYLEQRGLRLVHIRDFEKRARTGPSAAFPTPLPDDAYSDNWIARNGLELLENAPRGRPWFLQVNFTGPHNPWDVTAAMEASCRSLHDLPLPTGSEKLTPEQHLRVRQNYSAMIENIDRWLGEYLSALERRGELDDTLVVYSSDHGEMLGDRGMWGKSVPWQPSVGVPLVISGAGVRRGVTVRAPATILDLTATFLDAAGVDAMDGMTDTRSMLPFLRGETPAPPRTVVRSALHEWRAAFDGRWKLIEGVVVRGRKSGAPPSTLLFDLDSDPYERHNLAAERPDIVATLRPHLLPSEA